MRIRIRTDDLDKVGMHEIKISGKILTSSKLTFTMIKIEIKDPCIKTVIQPSVITSFEYKAGSGLKKIVFEPWKESFNGKCEPFTYSLTDEADPFLKVNY
jgi:hypothetical protein